MFVPTIFLAAFGFSIGYDLVTSAYWDAHNKGVSTSGGARWDSDSDLWSLLSSSRLLMRTWLADTRTEAVEGHPPQVRRPGVNLARTEL